MYAKPIERVRLISAFFLFCLDFYICAYNQQSLALHQLYPKSQSQRKNDIERLSAMLWHPNTKVDEWTDSRIMQHNECPLFNLDILWSSSIRRRWDHAFSWTSISQISLLELNQSYIIMGGSWPRKDETVIPREGGLVLLCKFGMSTEGDIVPISLCLELSDGIHERSFLGAAVSAIQIAPTMGLLAYCDPFWTGQSLFPAGRCFLQLIHGKHVRPRHPLDAFCATGDTVTEPCMSGFSVGLISSGSGYLKETVKGIQVLVGQPLATPRGRAQMLFDPFNTAKMYTINPPRATPKLSFGGYFGYSIAGNFLSSVSYAEENSVAKDNTRNIHVFKTGSTETSSTNADVQIKWQGSIANSTEFSGFGTAMIELSESKLNNIIVVGAPHARSGFKNSQIGAIYLFCLSKTTSIGRQFNVPIDSYDDFLYGSPGTDQFGYALSSVGDINGDGVEDIAVGAPQIHDESKPGKVFIISIRSNCTFDPVPLEILEHPLGASYFGSILPKRGSDLDFNGFPDIAIPVPLCDNCKPTPLFFTSRPQYKAMCKFEQPRWLAHANVKKGTKINIALAISLQSNLRRSLSTMSVSEILSAAKCSLAKLIHQVNPDIWAMESKDQRMNFTQADNIMLDNEHNHIHLNFSLFPQMDVEHMPSLEQPNGAIRVQYRFLIPCPSNSPPSLDTGTCSNSAWLHRPVIDWSDCNFQLGISRYVCLPRDRCESDLTLRVTDEKTPMSINSTSNELIGESLFTYGDKNGSMPRLLLKVFNQGPTFAGGVWINFAFYGNLFESLLEIGKFDSNGLFKFEPAICVHPHNNDTWMVCKLGRIEAPPISALKPAFEFRLTPFYKTQLASFDTESGVNITLSSATFDPNTVGNSIRWNYKARHLPVYLITPGANPPSAVRDNRTKPVSWPKGYHQRVRVEDIGPRLYHTFQVEHTGPSKHLMNVTMRIRVPIMLLSKQGEIQNNLLYIFDEVRSLSESGSELNWHSLAPVVRLLSSKEIVLTHCVYNRMDLINPNGWIGIDLASPSLQRSRRESEPQFEAATENNWNESTEAIMDVAYGVRGRRKLNPHEKVYFRRVPKEVIQCGRQGRLFGKPTCLEIVCKVPELEQKRPVQVSLTGWLYARTFFEFSTSDIEMVTSISIDQGAVPRGVEKCNEPAGYFELPQVFYFSQLKPKLFCQIPIWPIIVGLVLGIILLSLLIILLYWFGFFRRKKHKLAVSGRGPLRRATRKSAPSYDTNDRNGDVVDFGNLKAAEEARKRYLQLRKHPEHVAILHPHEIERNSTHQP